jgi:protein-tyrosine phosphatase
MEKIRILVICTGNICRSPTAEAVLRQQIDCAGLTHQVAVESAGTHSYNLGSEPDQRAQAVAALRGYRMAGKRARCVEQVDFLHFDYLLAMDEINLMVLKRFCPPHCMHKLGLFMDYSANYHGEEVPDPYGGSVRDFERVLDMVEDGARGLLTHVRAKLMAENAAI